MPGACRNDTFLDAGGCAVGISHGTEFDITDPSQADDHEMIHARDATKFKRLFKYRQTPEKIGRHVADDGYVSLADILIHMFRFLEYPLGIPLIVHQFYQWAKSSSYDRKIKEAISKGDADFIRHQLMQGMDPGSFKHGTGALTHAMILGQEEIVKLLILYGADLNAKNMQGWTPLMWATECGRTKVVRMLLNHGADALAKDHDGDTALMIAAYHGNEEIVKSLLEKDDRVSMKDYNGRNALSIAKAQGHENIVRILERK